ncbi:MAG: hypothetical protein ABR512_10100 [Desulfopila sp.]
MPNTLIHIAIQAPLSRALVPRVQIPWILLGLIIPDIPWILQRIAVAGQFGDPYQMRLYFTSQASLLFCLVLSFTFALFAKRVFLVFSVLALNNLLHLFLDAMQIKWGNGVHFFAPLSWTPTHFDLLWPEHTLMYLLSVMGFFYLVKNITTISLEDIAVNTSSMWKISCLCLGLYFLLPLFFMSHIIDSNANYIAIKNTSSDRVGRIVELDRSYYSAKDSTIALFTGEKVPVVGSLPPKSGIISIKGRFLDQKTIQSDAYHPHGSTRDYASMAGLLFSSIIWLTLLTRRFGKSRRSFD